MRSNRPARRVAHGRNTEPSRAFGLLAAGIAVVMALGACGSDDEPPAASASTDDAAGEEEPAETPAPTEEAPVRSVTFTEPVESQFTCDCLSQVAGAHSSGLVAIAKDMRSVETPDAEPRVAVLDPTGEVLWEKPADDETITTVPFPQYAATEPAIVVQHKGALTGYAWKNGKRLWAKDEIDVAPELVDGSDDLVAVAGRLHEGSQVTHPFVGLLDTKSGTYRWSAENLNAYTIDGASGALYAVRLGSGGEKGAKLLRVDLESGAETAVRVPSWKAKNGTGLVVRGEALVFHVGSADNTKPVAVEVDWQAAKPRAVDVEAPESSTGGVTLPESMVEVDRHEEAGLTLAVERDQAGKPSAAVMLDQDGTELWTAAADDVLSWSEPDEDGERSFGRADIEYAPDIDTAVVVVDRSPDDSYQKGAVASKNAATYTVLDARTGEELWTWGDPARFGGFEVDAGGVAIAWQAWSGDLVDRKARPLEIAALDLLTGEPDWEYTGERTTRAALTFGQLAGGRNGGTGVVLVSDGPWLVFSRTELTAE